MTRNRLVQLAVAGFVLATGGLLSPILGAGRAGSVRGVIQDPSGRRLEGVEINVNPLSDSLSVLRATSNGTGEFFLPGLAPGLYLLTAQKAGYESASSGLNTLIESSIALTLAPVLGDLRQEGPDWTQAPTRRTWVLRQPRRDVLRERGIEGAWADLMPAAGPEAGDGHRLEADFQQTFAFGGGTGARGQGSRLNLDAAIAPDLDLILHGVSEQRRDSSGSSLRDAGKEHSRRSVEVGTRLGTGAGDRVEVSALLDARRYSTIAAAGSRPDGYEQDVRDVGARWEHDLGAAGEMDVAMDFRSVEVLADPGSAPSDSSPFGNADSEVWQAVGSYRVDIDERRQMQVGVRARRLRLDNPGSVAIAVLGGSGGLPGAGPEGAWALDLNGREERSLGGPMSLDYGFSYHRRTEEMLSEGIDDAFIPEAGLTLARPDGSRWSAAISLALDRPQDDRPQAALDGPANPQDDRLLSRLGYRLGMDYPFRSLGLNLALNATYHPFAYAPPGGSGAPLEVSVPLGRSLMLSEGNAESLEVGLRLEKRFKKFVGALGSQMGQVEGYLLTGYFDEVPVQQVSYNLVRYMVASARGYHPERGTLVHVDYQRYLNNPGEGFDPASLSYQFERVDLALEQDLPFIALWNARWRMLLDLQSLRTGSLRGGDLAALREAGVRDSERRLSGGLAIRF